MTLLIFGLIYTFSVVAVAFVAFEEGQHHRDHRVTDDYNTGHSDGFEDGWQAAQQVNRVVRKVGHGAHW